MPVGRICKGQSGLYEVHSDGGIYMCRAASRIRKEDGIKPLTGDMARFADNSDGTGFIEEILPRRNSFVRPAVANADVLVIVVAGTHPAPLPINIDKLCCIAESKNVSVMLVFTKSDLGGIDELKEIYSHTPYPCFEVGKGDTSAVEDIKNALKGRMSVFTGASGVGKSTLINLLFDGINASTGELSRIKRGKNTTRVTELFERDGCFVADTPGFSMLDMEQCIKVAPADVITLFPEAAEMPGSCKYTKCSHTKEEGCAVIRAVNEGVISKSRHESYVKLYAEAKEASRY